MVDPGMPRSNDERARRWAVLLRAKDAQLDEILRAAETAYSALLQGDADTALAALGAALPQARRQRER